MFVKCPICNVPMQESKLEKGNSYAIFSVDESSGQAIHASHSIRVTSYECPVCGRIQLFTKRNPN